MYCYLFIKKKIMIFFVNKESIAHTVILFFITIIICIYYQYYICIFIQYLYYLFYFYFT